MSSELHLTASLDRDVRRVLVKETIIGLLVNTLVFPSLLWLVNVPPPQTVGGPDGVVASLAKATAMAVFLMTVIQTLVLRKQGAKGALPAVWPRVLSWSKFAPRNVVARAVLFVLMGMVTLMPIGAAVCVLFDLYPMTKVGFWAVNVGYGVLMGAVVTPVVTLAAMADQPIRRN
jgi:hypothetical protein